MPYYIKRACCWYSKLRTSWNMWVHKKCSGKTDRLTENRNSVCLKYSSEIVPAANASLEEVNIKNDKFHVEPTLTYLGDTNGQCGGYSDAVSTCITLLWKALQELLPILTNHAIQTKHRGNVYNMCVWKKLLYGSDSNNRSPVAACCHSINEMLPWNRLRFNGHLLPCIMLMEGNKEINHVRGFVMWFMWIWSL